jgi:hypothetical protein
MDNLRQQMFSSETPPEDAPSSPPSSPQLLRAVQSISPGQRLLLSVFLFMDVCVICFSCLLLFRKISLPF